MTTAAPGRRRRALAFDLDAYQGELAPFAAELGEVRWASLGNGSAAATAPIYARHESLFSRSAVDALTKLRDAAGESADTARALIPFAAEGYAERQVVDLSDRIAAAEARAIIVWRGERISYGAAPVRIAEISERSERNGLDASYREAVEAINPLREERMVRLRVAWRELGHADPFAMVAVTRGIDFSELTAQMQRFLVESETPYFAALRRFLAEIDIEQGDASVADLWHVLRGAGWDAWFDGRRLRPALDDTLVGLGIDPATQSRITVDLERGGIGQSDCVAVNVPGDIRVSLQPRGGCADFEALLHQVGRAEALAHASPDAPAAYRYASDQSLGEAYGWIFGHLTLEADWLVTELGMSEDELVSWRDFAAFRMLHEVRRVIAGYFHEQRLHGLDEPALQRAYYAGTLGMLTGVRYPESTYLADVADNLHGVLRFRGWCAGSSLADWLRRNHGGGWWRTPAAGEALRQGWGRGRQSNVDALVAHLGYDRLDWRPILRQIRTHLIGEMSGYGGPNITTRAGTRKV